MRSLFTSFTLALASLTAGAGSAFAADTPFNGFNAGLNLGYGTYETTWHDQDYDWHGSTLTFQDEAATAGFNLGYDHQAGSFVIGGAFTWDYTFFDAATRYSDDVDVRNEVRWISTLHIRAGVTQGSTLFYFIGGIALADISHAWWEDNDPSDSWEKFENNKLGYVLGLGLEHMVTDKISVRGEFMNATFGETNEENPDGYRVKVGEDITTFRLGANYRF